MTLRHQIIALAIFPLVIAILAITTFITWQSANLTQDNIATFEQNMLKAKETQILNLIHLALSATQTHTATQTPTIRSQRIRSQRS